MKYAVIAVFSVVTCVVYGQLPANWNNDPYGYRPYFASPSSAKSNLADFRTAQKTNREQPIRNMFNRGLVARMEFLEVALENLTKEWRTKTSKDVSEANTRVTDLTKNLASTKATLEQTTNELLETQSTLESMKTDLRVTKQDLLDTKQSFALLKADLMKAIEGTHKMLEATTNELGNTKMKIEGLTTKWDGTSKDLTAATEDVKDTRNELQCIKRNLQVTGVVEMKEKVDVLTTQLNETARNFRVTNALVGNLSALVFGTIQNSEKAAKDLNATKTAIDSINRTLKNTTQALGVTQMDLNETKTRMGNLTAKLDGATEMLLATTRNLTHTKMKLDDVDAELKGTAKVLATTVKESGDTKWKIGNLTTKLNGTTDHITNITKVLEDTRTEVERIKIRSQVASKESSDTGIRMGQLLKQLSETAKNVTDTNVKIDSLRTIIFGTTQTLARTTKDLTETKTKLEAIDMDLKNATQRLVKTKNNGANFEAGTIESIKEKLEEVAKRARETKSKVEGLSTNLNATMKDLTDTKAEVQIIKRDLRVTSRSSTETKVKIGSLASQLDAGTSATSIDRIPTSCKDLHQIGHRKSGLFSVMGTKQIETVYCDFTKDPNGADFQKWIGYEDVQSMPTYFYVKKNAEFSTMNVPIPYEVEVVNTGSAMDTATGTFTAPRKGTYFFSFNGLAIFPPTSSKLGASLYFNGTPIGMSFVRDGSPSEDRIVPVTLQSTLKLKAGDKIWVQITYLSKGVALFDDSDNQTHFTGFLLQEDISLLPH